MATVDQYEYSDQVGPFGHVVLNHALKLRPCLLADTRISKTGKVDEVPSFVDHKVIDQLCFAWCRTRFGKAFLVDHLIDEGRLTHIGPAHKGKFGFVGGRQLRIMLCAAKKICCCNLHYQTVFPYLALFLRLVPEKSGECQ